MSDPLSTTPVTTSSTPPATTVPVGSRFEMLGRIGAGNHGVVFRARDSQLQREVAIKRFSHFVADDPRAMRRITREVGTLARVSHRNVVTVHDLVHMPDGDGEVTPHLVMELVEGTSLRDLLNRQGPSLRSVIVVRGVLEGLIACHQAGILHLDIKPANVLVTPDGGVKIVDFGIARAASDATATVAGTPHYMAPEQFEGNADERSDVYSVGCLLYECLTGVPPFQGTMASPLLAHRTQPRPDPRDITPQVSASLVAVVHRAMAVDPDQRFASVEEMLRALEAVGDGVDLAQPVRPVIPVGPAAAPSAPPRPSTPTMVTTPGRW
ncbi:serine/threonine-protein kinase [Aeromicrobium sp. UC242_57]|uniref:serine/threonine-protein kinase n=1 Tax=Aeromicrobium sp. UC242_57 TaxID=3374624 RepID=UPI00378A7AA0